MKLAYVCGVLALSAAARANPAHAAPSLVLEPCLGGSAEVLPEDVEAFASVCTLLHPRKSAKSPEVQAIAKGIGRLGPTAVKPVVEILFGEREETWPEFDVHPAAIEQRVEILIGALRELPASTVLAELDQRASPTSSTDVRLFVMRLYAEVGGAQALSRALAILSGFDPIQWEREFVAVQVEDILGRMIVRSPKAAKELEAALKTADTRLAPMLLRACCRSSSGSIVPMLLRSLGRDAKLDLLALKKLSELADAGRIALESNAAELIRKSLASTDVHVRCEALMTLAKLGDDASAESMMERMGRSTGHEAVLAQRALELLAGRSLGDDTALWATWLAGERAWYAARAPTIDAAVAALDSPALVEVGAEFSQHALYRVRIAVTLRPALLAPDTSCAGLTCALLASLGVRASADWLPELLNATDEGVRQAALEALQKLTRRDLPADSVQWRAYLGGT